MISSQKNWRFIKQYGWLMGLFSALLLMLVMLSKILQNASEFADSYSTLLILSFAGLTILFGFLIKTLMSLYVQFKDSRPGIQLTIKLSTVLTFVVGVPIAIIYYFAISFIHQGIDQWFDVKTEQALSSAVELVKTTQDNQVRNELNHLLTLAAEKGPTLIKDPIDSINKVRSLTQSQEASIYSKNGQLIAYSSQFALNILPNQPSSALFQQIRQEHNYAAIENVAESNTDKQVIRLIVPIKDDSLQVEYVLQVILPISDQITSLANQVKISSGQYQELSYLKGPLKTSFTLILSLVLVLTLVTAILFAIQSIQNIARPIRTLAKGTQAVMEGDYSIRMPIETEDDFGQLIGSFNKMTQQISKARNDIKFSHQQTEVQKLYLQAIIKSLQSGVVTLNDKRVLKTINDSANQILNTNLYKQLGKPIEEVLTHDETRHLSVLIQKLFAFFEEADSWNRQLEFDCIQGQKILLIHGSILPSLDKDSGGYIVVIEDITQIVQAQIHAAWSDVAQRLAHEIKNPLTPIQLSAERLNYKLHKKLGAEDQNLLGRMTHTIIEQVDAMKNLVQAFTEYADTPEIHRRKFKINELIEDVVTMYRAPDTNWYVTCELDEVNPIIHADAAKLRQLLHNLVKNALEACEAQEETLITLSTRAHQQQVIISICDNGPGIPSDTKNWIFEPYATNKPKGTGLGLAIVKKIVDEHQGNIRVESTLNEGTCFIITLDEKNHFASSAKSSSKSSPKLISKEN